MGLSLWPHRNCGKRDPTVVMVQMAQMVLSRLRAPGLEPPVNSLQLKKGPLQCATPSAHALQEDGLAVAVQVLGKADTWARLAQQAGQRRAADFPSVSAQV